MLSESFHFCDPLKNRDQMSKFLKNTLEQCERFAEIKQYPKKLLSLRNQLREQNRLATFQMFSSLSIKFTHPLTGKELIGVIREMNATDIILITPQLSYSIIFENCPTGLECFLRMKTEGFFSEPKRPLFDSDFAHGGISL